MLLPCKVALRSTIRGTEDGLTGKIAEDDIIPTDTLFLYLLSRLPNLPRKGDNFKGYPCPFYIEE